MKTVVWGGAHLALMKQVSGGLVGLVSIALGTWEGAIVHMHAWHARLGRFFLHLIETCSEGGSGGLHVCINQ